MRPTRFLLASALSAAASTGAACVDTLYMQSITVFTQTLKNSVTLGDWDSVKVDPWNANDLLKAGPLGKAFGSTPDTATHYLQIGYDCGEDTLGAIVGARVIDKRVRSGEDWTHQKSSETATFDSKVSMLDGEGKGISFDGDIWSIIWSSGLIQVGKHAASSPRIAYEQAAVHYKFTSSSTGSGVSTSYAGGFTTQHPLLSKYEETLSSFLSSVAGDVASIGSGVDSVRTEVVRYRYEYGYDAHSSRVAKRAQASTVRVVPSAAGWSIELPQAAVVSIHAIDGRQIRQFPASRRVLWDGRDASGAKVHPGMWVVRAHGHGAVPVLVR